MKRQLISLIFVGLVSFANAQWIQTSFPAVDYITCFAFSGNNIYAGTGGYGLFLSTNNGNSWVMMHNGLSINTDASALAINDTSIFAATDNGIFFSSNKGASWKALDSSTVGITALAINDTSIFAGTTVGVYYTSNNGASWAAIDTGLPSHSWINDLVLN